MQRHHPNRNKRVRESVPSINSDLCARTQLLRASCSSCVQACPTGALFETESDTGGEVALGLNTEACTGCGACRAACEKSAVSIPLNLPVAPAGSTGVTLVCQHHSTAGMGPAIPCLHALGLNDLARFWLAGIRKILLASGDCSTCPLAAQTRLQDRIDQFNILAQSRDLPELHHSTAGPKALHHWCNDTSAPDRGRRAFLRGFAAPVLAASDAAPDDRSALQRFLELGEKRKGRLFPHVPVIAANTCTACDNCINLCPNGALILVKDNNGETSYVVNASACTGCCLCEDICDFSAVEVRTMHPEATAIQLTRYHCRACGVARNATGPIPPQDGLCHICRQTRQHKKLFQVLE